MLFDGVQMNSLGPESHGVFVFVFVVSFFFCGGMLWLAPRSIVWAPTLNHTPTPKPYPKPHTLKTVIITEQKLMIWELISVTIVTDLPYMSINSVITDWMRPGTIFFEPRISVETKQMCNVIWSWVHRISARDHFSKAVW